MTPDLFQLLLDLATHLADDGTLRPLSDLARAGYWSTRFAGETTRLARRLGGRRPSRWVVEPGMDFITPSATAAGIRATGSVTGALIGRYRPTGVPRLGSKEDRAEAYRRLLDASTRAFNYGYQFAHLKRKAGRAAHKLLLGQAAQQWEVSSDLISALQGVRLCGTVQVIAAAEKVVAAVADLELNEKNADLFQEQADAVVAAQGDFLEACREDLAYTARWWQIRRRRKERRFLAEQARR